MERVKTELGNPCIGPETLALMITSRCNLDCLYCRGGYEADRLREFSPQDELSFKDLCNLFLDSKELGVKEINLGGLIGEPFCRKDILEIMKKIKELGFAGSMTTNGSFLTSSIAEVISSYDWDILLVSFDSTDSYIHHRLRPSISGKTYFREIVNFLNKLQKIRSRVRVLLNVVVNRWNYKNIPEIVEFANKYKNIESVNILKMLPTGFRNYEELQLGPQELEEFKSILTQLSNEKKLLYIQNWLELSNAGKDVDEEISNYKGCFTNYYILSIDANGDIIKCPQYQEGLKDLNVKRKSLKDIWIKEHSNFRRNLAKYAPCFDGCCTILKEQNRLIYKHIISKGQSRE